jgi:hypothetical protein
MLLLKFIGRTLGLRQGVRARLWRAGGLTFSFMLTFIVGSWVLSWGQAQKVELGLDFLPFYYGGTCALTGHYEQLYDLSATRAFEIKTGHDAGLTLGPGFGPWWNPPFAAWMFAPLAALPFRPALHLWWTISVISLAISIALMCRMLRGGWKSWLLAAMLIASSMPAILVFCHGQNAFVSLLLLTATVSFWRANQSFWAGVVCGLLFYKPQAGALIAAVLCLCRGRRALMGVALTGTSLLLVNMLTMPGTLKEFVFQMPLNLHWMQEESVYRWARHVTFKAFWRKAIQDDAVGFPSLSVIILWIICETALLGGLMTLIVKTRPNADLPSRRDRLIAATIIAMPLLMPFYFDYDLLLISVGIVVYAADCQRDAVTGAPLNAEDRWLVRAFSVMYVLLIIMYMIVGLEHTLRWRIHPIVPLLAVAAGMLIRRGLRTPAAPAAAHTSPSLPTALAA